MKDLWYPDAVGIASQEEFLAVIHRSKKIESFLSKIGDGDNTYFLIGPKGSGKTHLLLCKSYLYHHAEKGYKFNADSTHLVEYVEFPRNSLSQDDLQKFRNPELWKNIWRLCLVVVALKSAEIDLPQLLRRKVEGLLGDSSQISDILFNIFNNRKKIQVVVNLSGELVKRINDIKSGVAIFVDNVDQAFEDIITEVRDGYDLSDRVVEAATETWVNAQMGLVDAIYGLCSRNPHLKIFATVRLEAFRIDRPRGHNYEYHGIKLHYEKEEIQLILNTRVQAIHRKKDISELLGFGKLPHSYYRNTDGTPYEENVFDFLYRHTYGRPREINAIGQQLDRLISSENYQKWDNNKRQYEVREIVNEEAKRFFERFKQEIIPRFDENKFRAFVKEIRSNVFSQQVAKKLDSEILNFYFTIGLLGYAQKHPSGALQKFRDFSEYEFGKLEVLPPAEYYFIHPTLNRTLIQAENFNVLNEYHLIGPNLPFYLPQFTSSSQEQKTEYYKPRKVVGDRWEKPYHRQQEPLKNYYEVYFKRRDDVLNQLLTAFEKSFREKFSAVAQCYLANSLFQKYGEPYQKLIDRTQKEVRRAFSQKTVRYQAELRLIIENIDDARSRFGHRLYGRLMTLACCFFT